MYKIVRIAGIMARTLVISILLTGFLSIHALADTTDDLVDFFLDHYDITPDFEWPILNKSVLAKAQPDECFVGVGDEDNDFDPNLELPCVSGAPKVNQAYVWGMAKLGNDIWFGTAPNTVCLLLAGFFREFEFGVLQTPSLVCEFDESQYNPLSLPPQFLRFFGDWRPFRIFRYNTESRILEDKTPISQLIMSTTGIRSAGAMGDVVFLGGPDLFGNGVNLFAFDSNGNFIDATTYEAYNNIRKWLVVDGVLYTTVRTKFDPENPNVGGEVLRWAGTKDDPFHFDVVGVFDSEGAELAMHEGRFFISTWPQRRNLAGLYMSPPVPQGGLTGEHKDQWEKVWNVGDYEADPVTAAVYGGGALASYEGYLYWGTMHVPFISTYAHFLVYGPQTEDEIINSVLGTFRSASIFRGKDFGTDQQEVELLYGMEEMPVYQPLGVERTPKADVAGEWVFVNNNMGQAPKYGPSGFGNPFNNYTWTMSVFGGQLYVGTMDWSYLIGDVQENAADIIRQFFPDAGDIELPEFLDSIDLSRFYGADLYRFASSNSDAVPEDLQGVGNYTNYGIRTMIADEALYLGTANPMNLMTVPNDNLPEGGWELLKLTSSSSSSSGGVCFISTVRGDF